MRALRSLVRSGNVIAIVGPVAQAVGLAPKYARPSPNSIVQALRADGRASRDNLPSWKSPTADRPASDRSQVWTRGQDRRVGQSAQTAREVYPT